MGKQEETQAFEYMCGNVYCEDGIGDMGCPELLCSGCCPNHDGHEGIVAACAEDPGRRDETLNKRLHDALSALGALGGIGGGYCFCSADRDPDKSDHEPECRDARAVVLGAMGDSNE